MPYYGGGGGSGLPGGATDGDVLAADDSGNPLWKPSIFTFSDDFAGANGASLGSPWTNFGSNPPVLSTYWGESYNLLKSDDASFGGSGAVIETNHADVAVSVKYHYPNSNASWFGGLCLRYVDDLNYIICLFNQDPSARLYIKNFVAGNVTLQSTSASFTGPGVGGIIEASVVGAIAKFSMTFDDGTFRTAQLPVDPALRTSTKHGVCFNGDANTSHGALGQFRLRSL